MSRRPIIDREILSILDDYHLFIESDKHVEMPFCIDKLDKNHLSALKGEKELKSISPLGQTVLECEMRERSEYNYSFKILTDAIGSRMLFRLDEGDGTHRNRHLPVPIDQQQVTTPHFHVFGDDGIMYAYKTAALNACPVPLNIHEGFTAFCEESHINQDDIKIIVQEKGTLPLEFAPEADPLIDILFP